MRTHTIKVRGRRASIDDRMLVQGTVGEDVLALDLDEEWDGLVVTVAFKWQHDSSIVAKQVEGGYEVPWECNQQPGKVLIAVEGTKDGKVMRHATIGHPMVVLPSEEASGTSPTEPTVSEYRKVYEDVKLATATANGAADDAKEAAEDVLVAAGNADAQAAAAQLASQVAANAAADVKRRADSGEFKGEKGDPGPKLTFADLTEADKAELQKPATDAAATANAAAKAANDAADAANTAAEAAVSDARAAIAEVKATEAKLYPAAENILVGSEAGAVAHVEDAFAGASLRKITVEGACKQDGIPSPDAPKPIAVVENPTVKVVGRNVLDFAFPAFQTAYSNGIAVVPSYAFVEKRISLPYTAPSSSSGFGFVQRLMPGSYAVKTLNAPKKATLNVAGYASREYVTDRGNKIWHIAEQYLDAVPTFKIEGDRPQWVVFCFASEWGDGANKITYPADFKAVVEYGGTATEYKPHTSQTLTFALPAEHPYLAKLPDGTADTIEVDEEGNVELVARVARALPSEQTILFAEDANGASYVSFILVNIAKSATKIISNAYVASEWTNKSGYIYCPNVNDVVIRDNRFTSEAQARELLDGVVVYISVPEQRYPLGKIEMPKAQDSIVNAWTDAEVTPNTSISYVRDVNIVIANLESAIASITEG